jgi:signal transduction histidine kinase
LHISCSIIDTNDFLSDLVQSIEPQIIKKQQTLILEFKGLLPPINADRDRLQQIFLNLINNAIKFNSSNGKIILCAYRRGSFVEFEVQDEGAGIDEEDQQRIFLPYFQLVKSEENYGGLGLGLAISKILVELHDGKIWIKSNKQSGSIFGFSIPVYNKR